MKTSLILISTLLVLSVMVPFILFIYNSSKNNTTIKKQSQLLLKTNGIIYGATEVWRKNYIGISNDKKTLTYINFKKDIPFLNNISLAEISQCNILKDYSTNANKAISLKKLDLQLVNKSNSKAPIIINFFNIDEDLNEDFEFQRIEKWQQIIKASINNLDVSKMAS